MPCPVLQVLSIHFHSYSLVIAQTKKNKDLDKDGKISFQEYVGDRGRDHSKEWLMTEKERFDQDLDRNKDGYLDDVEIGSWIIPSNDEIAQVGLKINECIKNGPIPASFSVFSFFQQLTENTLPDLKSCWRLDWNCRPLLRKQPLCVNLTKLHQLLLLSLKVTKYFLNKKSLGLAHFYIKSHV